MKNLAKLLMSLIILSLLGVPRHQTHPFYYCKNLSKLKKLNQNKQNKTSEPRPKSFLHLTHHSAFFKKAVKIRINLKK